MFLGLIEGKGYVVYASYFHFRPNSIHQRSYQVFDSFHKKILKLIWTPQLPSIVGNNVMPYGRGDLLFTGFSLFGGFFLVYPQLNK